MRADTVTPFAQAVARLRTPLGRAKRRLAAQGAASRWALGVAGLIAVAAVAYAATAPAVPAYGLVRSGLRFSADDQVIIGRELDAKNIRFRVNDRRQIEVAVGRVEEANAIITKLMVGRRPLSEIETRALESSVWETPDAQKQRREQAANDRLAAMIEGMDGIVSAYVKINPVKSRGVRPAQTATAFVCLESENDREISPDTVEAVQSLIIAAEPEVKAVSVYDRKGRVYANAHDPALGDRYRTRSYRDQLRQEIQQDLDWLRGAQVSVQVTPPPPVAPPVTAAPAPLPAPAPAAEEVVAPSLSMGVNEPLREPAPEPPAAPRAAPPPAVAAQEAPPAPPEPAADELLPRVRVWVKVPRSYYLKAVSGRDASLGELQPLVERTKRLIESSIRKIVPEKELDELTVDTIPDELPARNPSPLPEATGTRWNMAAWVPAAVAGGATVVVLGVAFRLATARRPAPRVVGRSRDGRNHFKIDEASDPGPGPSERVRELIRLSPEAAASVLNRWTQGGTIG